VTVTDGDETTRYRVVAAHFEDTATFFPMLGEDEVWQLINLTGDTHRSTSTSTRSRSWRAIRSATRSQTTASASASSPPQSRSSATPTTSTSFLWKSGRHWAGRP
jgi:hypothetical protein